MLSVQDIRAAEFTRGLRGYDVDEVRAFLGSLADDVDKLLRREEERSREVKQLQEDLEHYRSLEQGLRDTMLAARSNSEETRENARREAELILREAELKAEQQLQQVRVRMQHLRDELEELRAQKQAFLSRMRHALSSQQELLEVLARDTEEAGQMKQEDGHV